MRLGFTGTEHGLTNEQRQSLVVAIRIFDGSIDEAHHGCCKGADVDFHWIVRQTRPAVPIVGWRATTFRKQDPSVILNCDTRHDPAPPLVRNRSIVISSDHLIACPREYKEIQRSGVWATVRYAREAQRPITIIYPDGRREQE